MHGVASTATMGESRHGAAAMGNDLQRCGSSGARGRGDRDAREWRSHPPSLAPARGRVLDMFPNTGHYEVIVLLERR
jgi:hypothetical protein